MMGQRSSRTSRTSKRKEVDSSDHRAFLTEKLQQVDDALLELGCEPDVVEALEDAPAANDVKVVVGNSKMVAKSPGLVTSITSMVNKAYGYRRIDDDDVMDRLSMGDPGSSLSNRVLHIAFLGDRPVGCMSSTFKVPWAESGCGHWGLLVVDVSMQGKGIASTMVAAAERRLAGMCREIQMEYEYTAGDALSERLYRWYEGKCGFQCVTGPPRGRGGEFRKCRKLIPEDEQRRGEKLRLLDMRKEFASQLASLGPSTLP